MQQNSHILLILAKNKRISRILNIENIIRPVSYTHLDVYKRQHTHRHFSKNDFFSCFECSTIRICNNLEHDFFCHHHTSISLRNIIADSDFTTLKTWKKVVFRKVSVSIDFFSMVNDNSRKFKLNQIIFSIHRWFVEYSWHFVFGEDRLRERGSLPATFYVLKGYFLWQTITAANLNGIK